MKTTITEYGTQNPDTGWPKLFRYSSDKDPDGLYIWLARDMKYGVLIHSDYGPRFMDRQVIGECGEEIDFSSPGFTEIKYPITIHFEPKPTA